MLLWKKISYLWNCIFVKRPENDRDHPHEETIYQKMVDDDILELEISERIIELLGAKKTVHITIENLSVPERRSAEENPLQAKEDKVYH